MINIIVQSYQNIISYSSGLINIIYTSIKVTVNLYIIFKVLYNSFFYQIIFFPSLFSNQSDLIIQCIKLLFLSNEMP